MIAVTGANGLLGSFIVRKLIEENESVIAFKRKGSDTSLLNDINDKISWRDADIIDPVSLVEAFNGVDEVIHTAAIVSFNPRHADAIFKVNVEGTKNIVNTCLELNIKKLVFISSVAALGRLKGQSIINENNKWTENPLNSTYAESKYLAELEVYRGAEEGLNIVILNPSVILAPADWTKSSAKIFKYIWDEKPFYIDSHLNYVDVRDVANAAYMLLKNNYQGEKFILNGGAIPIKDLFLKIAERLKKKTPSLKLNSGLMRIVAIAESIRSRMLGSEPLISKETARLAGTYFQYKNDKIKKELNFNFQTIDQTLDWCCKYYMEQEQRKK